MNSTINLESFWAWCIEHQAWIISIASIFFNTWITTRFKIKTEQQSKKIQYDIQRKYMLTEIRTKHLLNIYPGLYHSLRLAGSLCVVVDTITRKLDKNPLMPLEDLQSLIKEHFDYVLSEKSDLGLQQLVDFTDDYEKSLLYISDTTDELLQKAKGLFLDLHLLVKNAITNSEYQTYDRVRCIDLIDRARSISAELKELKYKIARSMNQELSADDQQ